MKTILCSTLIATCAFRYALGRRTYVVGEVVRLLLTNIDKFSPAERALIVEEIDAQRRLIDGLGDRCDVADWMRVREAFSAAHPTEPRSDAT